MPIQVDTVEEERATLNRQVLVEQVTQRQATVSQAVNTARLTLHQVPEDMQEANTDKELPWITIR